MLEPLKKLHYLTVLFRTIIYFWFIKILVWLGLKDLVLNRQDKFISKNLRKIIA